MLKRLLILLGLLLPLAVAHTPASAQNTTCATRPVGDSSNACASTKFVRDEIGTNLPLPNGQIFVGNSSNDAQARTMSQDCTLTNAGVITCTKTNNVSFGSFATGTDAANLSGTLNAARLPTSGVSAGTYGNSLNVPQCTFDATGRATACANVAIAAGSTVPGGRVTHQSGVPYPTADNTSVQTLYYAPVPGLSPTVPICDGSTVCVGTQFTASNSDAVGLSLALGGSASWASGSLYDLFVGSDGGTIRFCSGPAYTNSGAGTSARSAAISLFKGVLTNTASMTCRYASGSTFTCSANTCTYVGTFLATANGQTAVQLHPIAAANGPNSVVGFCNANNAIKVTATAQDSTSTWSYASATARNANNSANNRIRIINCMGYTPVSAFYSTSWSPDVSSPTAATLGIGYNLDCTSATNFSGAGGAGAHFQQGASNNTAVGTPLTSWYAPYPVQGLSFIQACEQSTAVSVTFYGNDFMQLYVEFYM